jgi:phage tail sheath protein FI
VATLEVQPTDDTERGYQALPLQDTYSAATVEKVTGKTNSCLIYGVTEGTWANTTNSSPISGLQVKVNPGTQAGTKKLSIYWDSALVEVYDNLGIPSAFPTTAPPLEFEATINTNTPSGYITIKLLGSVTPANTVDPWNTSATQPVPQSPTNTAKYGVPLPGGALKDGFNGEAATAQDFVGTLNPVDDTMTGLKSFEDTDNVYITTLCAPGITSADATMVPVQTQMRDTAYVTKSIGLIDVPASFNGVPMNVWDAIDWHNGQGKFNSRGKLDTAYLACFWNWFTMNDPITQQPKLAPPTIGALRVMAYTWLHDQPWYAAAGENRGVISEATSVMFPRLSDNAKEAMYGSGNSVNPIIQRNGVIMVYGERTLQRKESKLTAIHNLVLVEYVVQGLAAIGRKYVFDPNDLTLLNQLQLSMTQFLDGVKNLRGIEAYKLVCDESNNNAATRNRREVIVDLYIVPTDAVERIYINAVVRESGADLTNVTG